MRPSTLVPALASFTLACHRDGPSRDADHTGSVDTEDTDTVDTEDTVDPDLHTGLPSEDPVIPWLAAGSPPVAPPALPWLGAGHPDVAPPARACPTGWTEEPLPDGGHQCDPWPASGRETCADAFSMHVPGAPGCEPVGAVCPTDRWPADAGDAGTWYVEAGGAGDGSRDAPFGTIADALAASAPLDTIVVGAGTWSGRVVPTHDVVIRGLCPSLTTLTARTPDSEAGVVAVDGLQVTLRDLRIGDASTPAVVARGGAAVALEGVVIERVGNHGVSISDSAFNVHDTNLVGTRPAAGGLNGDGVFATGASDVVLERVSLSGHSRTGVWAEGESVVSAYDTAVFDIAPEPAFSSRGAAFRVYGTRGVNAFANVSIDHVHEYGIGKGDGASVDAQDLWIQHVANATPTSSGYGGLAGSGPGAITCAGVVIDDVPYAGLRQTNYYRSVGPLSCEDVVVRNVRAWSYEARSGVGVRADLGPDVHLARVLVEDTDTDGVVVGTNAPADVSDVLVRRSARMGWGAGVVVGIGAEATVERVRVEDAADVGVQVAGAALATLSDVSVGGAAGVGLSARDAELVLSRALVRDAAGAGVQVALSGSYLLEDVVVRDTRADALFGEGVSLRFQDDEELPTWVTLSRVALENGTGGGLTGGRADLVATDLTISSVAPLAGTGQLGTGLALAGGTLSLTRARIAGVHDAGIWFGSGALDLTDVAVSGVAPQDCVATTCPDETGATAVLVSSDARARLSGVLVEGAEVGLQVRGRAAVADVVSRDNTVGLDAVGGDLAAERLLLESNGTDEATEAQVVPDVTP